MQKLSSIYLTTFLNILYSPPYPVKEKSCTRCVLEQMLSKCVDKLKQQGEAMLLWPSLLHPTAERDRRNEAAIVQGGPLYACEMPS